MFASKATKPPTETAASLMSKLALRHGDHEREVNLEGMNAREVPRGLSRDFSKIPLFPADRVNRPQTSFPPAALPSSSIIQRKLAVGEINDPLEHEADRIADQGIRLSVAEPVIAPAPAQLSRKCAACEEEEPRKLRARPDAASFAGGSEA